MASRAGINTRADIDRRISQGRGSGEGKAYSPWLKVREVPSKGRCHRPFGIKTGRDHHLLSDLEHKVFLCQEFCSSVIDLREQYPLLPYGRTRDIAKTLGLDHPRYPRTSLDTVMTTDLLLTVKAGPSVSEDCVRIALCAKYVVDLQSDHVRQKLEIERLYWVTQGVQWYLVTERSVPDVLHKNLVWLRDAAILKPPLDPESLRRFLGYLSCKYWVRNTLKEDLDDAAEALGLEGPQVIALFKHALWHQMLRAPLATHQIDLQRPWPGPQNHRLDVDLRKAVAS